MIELFKAGTSHIVNGITCERQIVNEFGFEHLLDNGWHLDPKDCYPEPKVEVADSKVTVPDESPKKTSETSKLGKTSTKTAAR